MIRLNVYQDTFLLALATLLAASAAMAQSVDDEPELAAGRVVVGLSVSSQHITACAHCIHQNGLSFEASSSVGSDSLDQIFTELGVMAIKPVFHTEQDETTMAGPDPIPLSAIQAFHTSRRAAIMNTFPQRAARAPIGYPAPELSHVYELLVPEQVDVSAATARLLADPHVAFAHPSYVVESTQYAPNDPFFVNASVPNSWGAQYEDLWGLAFIGALGAWQDTRGAGVVAAVVDTGLDYLHDDIADNAWINPLEDLNGNGRVDGVDTCPLPTGDFNCIDDDGNGFVDDLRGYDFVTCDETVVIQGVEFCTANGTKLADSDPFDQHGHGTHVAGILGATGDNGVGILGVAPEVLVMPVRALNAEGSSTSNAEIAAALVYASHTGADIINNSWACTSRCPRIEVFELAVQEAYSLGSALVFAAGNRADDVRRYSPQNMFETFVAGAHDETGERSVFSNFGERLDVLAPSGTTDIISLIDPCHEGRNTLSLRASVASDTNFPACLTVPGGQGVYEYTRAMGTSMSSPHVAGAMSLVLAANPTASTDTLLSALQVSALDKGPVGFDSESGFGLLTLSAVSGLAELPSLRIDSPTRDAIIDPGMSPIAVTGTADHPSASAVYELQYRHGEAGPWTDITTLASANIIDGPLGVWDVSSLPPGHYSLRVRIIGPPPTSEVFSHTSSANLLTLGLPVTADAEATIEADMDTDHGTIAWWAPIPPILDTYEIRACQYDDAAADCPVITMQGQAISLPTRLDLDNGVVAWRNSFGENSPVSTRLCERRLYRTCRARNHRERSSRARFQLRRWNPDLDRRSRSDKTTVWL